MISLTCTHCQRVLTIDEAFAGGVCRCQHCGTIQTVPAHLREGKPDQPGPAGRLLYKHPRTGGGDSHVGTGLANLQDETQVGAGSPVPRRERAPRAAAPGEPPPAKPEQPWKLYAALGGIVLAGFFLIWLILVLTKH